jgi:hypothetical protein
MQLTTSALLACGSTAGFRSSDPLVRRAEQFPAREKRNVPTRRSANLTSDCDLEEKRRYKREFMRRWRSDPAHQERERARRQRDTFARKIRRANEIDTSSPLCGFCHSRRSVTEVMRLKVSNETRSGFVSARLPYCGFC